VGNQQPARSTAGYTTVMLRNIPNRYVRDMLIEQLDKRFKNQYDFVYLPIDFNSKCNVGYAFINFRTPQACELFIHLYNGVKAKACLPGFSSVKVCEVTYARVQGRDANMENLCDDKFIEKLIERPDWQPLFFDNKGKEIPFAKTLASRKKNSSHRAAGGVTPHATMPHAGMPMLPYGHPMTRMSPYMMAGSPAMMNMYGMPGSSMQKNYIFLPSLCKAISHNMVMVKNVPGKYTRQLFRSCVDENFAAKYDFLFLPGDSRGEGNRGIAFINFRNSKQAQKFCKMHAGAKAADRFPMFASSKNVEAATNCLHSVEKQLERLCHNAQKGSPEAAPNWQPLLWDELGEPKPFHMEKFMSMNHEHYSGGMPVSPAYGLSQIAAEASKAAEAAQMASVCAARALDHYDYSVMGGYDQDYSSMSGGIFPNYSDYWRQGKDYNPYAQYGDGGEWPAEY